jgi:hypothetical protein
MGADFVLFCPTWRSVILTVLNIVILTKPSVVALGANE